MWTVMNIWVIILKMYQHFYQYGVFSCFITTALNERNPFKFQILIETRRHCLFVVIFAYLYICLSEYFHSRRTYIDKTLYQNI
jgi:hypothetical protein